MSEITDLLLTGLLNQGGLLLGTVLFFAALGVPLPATVMLLAAGAFAQQGLLSGTVLWSIAVLAATAGDLCSYGLGRFGLALLPPKWQTSGVWKRASHGFAHWGLWSVFFSRFLFTPLALPVNLLAGSTRYPFPRFMLPVAVGEVIWVGLYGGLGYLFADSWEMLGDQAGNLAGILIGLLLLGVGGYLLLVRLRKTQTAPF